MPTPRPHHELMIAFAQGHEIQSREYINEDWEDDPDPNWNPRCQYRMKPETKPDVVRVANIIVSKSSGLLLVEGSSNTNLRLTFDGETGKLKSAEVLK